MKAQFLLPLNPFLNFFLLLAGRRESLLMLDEQEEGEEESRLKTEDDERMNERMKSSHSLSLSRLNLCLIWKTP